MLISVQLFVQGDRLQPDAITDLLGIRPELAHALGDVSTSASGKAYKRKVGLWKWGVTEDSQTADLSVLVIDFCSKLKNMADHLAKLPNADRAWIDIFVCHEPARDESNDINFSLSPSAIRELCALNLPIEFTTNLISASDALGTA